ncbi:MAG: hypothetical protein HUU06_06770, partial [Planctomycetaceae bacterium]|nr:hypothetical protein [Planctomycetaceae bacterium]
DTRSEAIEAALAFLGEPQGESELARTWLGLRFEAARRHGLVDGQAWESLLVEDLARRRAARDGARLDEALFGLEIASGWSPSPDGLMPSILRAVEAEATVGEICRSLEKSFGAYDPSRP